MEKENSFNNEGCDEINNQDNNSYNEGIEDDEDEIIKRQER